VDALTELQSLIARHAMGEWRQTPMSGLSVGTATVPSQPIHGMYEPLFVIVAQGAKRVVVADQAFDEQAGQYLVVPVDLPVSSYVTQASVEAPYLAAALRLKPELIASLLLEAGLDDRSADEPSLIGVSDAPADLLDAFVRLLRLLDTPSDAPILRPMIEREIAWRLLCGNQSHLIRQIGLADSRLSKIGRAIGWIREHFAESLHIDDLAERVAMSPTSFHRHFRAATAMSPLQYQKQIRLLEARSRLMARSDDVARVGFSVGYDSPSQFSREYTRLFGQPPSRDSAALRAALSP
jgi:AraC-like DNA-binding protein